ncbi:toll/interleukin-1 receptor domain-containing protein [Streptomyces ossamyceticus]|uniref:Toll/interleukin-1 receptor domain-containing protein n=1 Tax=Streptomyces ossamyceticus TaxID=249581 RepID=A0ABV2V9E2_9ACTN
MDSAGAEGPARSGPRYDVFLSYAWEDIDLAVHFQELLEARGLSVFRDVTGMRDYDDIPTVIRAALDGSRTLVALYTPSFPESQYCRWEMYTALTRSYHLSGQTRRVMAVVRGMRFSQVLSSRLKCLRLPAVTAALADVSDSVRRLVDGMDHRTFGDAPEPPVPSWYPEPAVGSRHFRGRLRELWQIRDAFDGDDGAGSDLPPVVFLVGGGGIGKTMLAEQYGRLFAEDHPGGVFVLGGLGSHPDSSRDPLRVAALVGDRIVAIARRLELVGPDAPATAARAALSTRLAATGMPYLWILDDLPAGVDTAVFRTLVAPTALGRTLVTSRAPGPGGQGLHIDVGELGELDSLTLLSSRLSPSPGAERQARRRLAEALGRHPLAMAVAAELVALPETGGFAGLLASFAEPSPDVLETAEQLGVQLPTAHGVSICATLLRGIDRLTPEGLTVMRLASVLAPALFSPDLLTDILGESDREGRDRQEFRESVRRGIAEAERLALARSDGTGSLSVHALVSRTVRLADHDDTARERARRAAVRVLGERLHGPAADAAARFRTFEALPHVRTVAVALAERDDQHLLNEAGRVRSESGDPVTGLELLRLLHDGCVAALGPSDITTLRVLAGLAVAHGMCGDHDAAVRLKHQAYEGLAALLGPHHPDTLTALNNVGVTHLDRGEYRTAWRVFGQVYRARSRKNGALHPDTLSALANASVAVSLEGRHALALRLRTSLLARTARVLGTRHPQYADALNGMGTTAYALGHRAEAADWFDRAYRLRRDLYGEQHGDTLDALENRLVAASADHAGTAGPGLEEECFREVYRWRLDLQGPSHPATVTTLRHCLVACRRGTAADGPAGDEDPTLPTPRMEPVQKLPHGVASGGVRLEADDMDRRIEIFELACSAQELMGDSGEDDEVRALMTQLWLAHATALMDQMDGQRDVALAVAEDTEAGLARELGRDHPLTRTATSLYRWIEELVDAAVERPGEG